MNPWTPVEGGRPPLLQRSSPPAAVRPTGFAIDTRGEGSCHWITVEGALSFDQMLSLLHVLGVESETRGLRTLLLDLRAVESAFQAQELAVAGREIAASFVHLRKLALLVPPNRVTGVSEHVAQREGMNMRVFSAERDALVWLAQPASG